MSFNDFNAFHSEERKGKTSFTLCRQGASDLSESASPSGRLSPRTCQVIHIWVARNESKYELTATFIELNMRVVSLLVVNFNNLQDEPVKGI